MKTPDDGLDVSMLSDAGRQRIASRLRFIAERVADGTITPDAFSLEAEWHEQPPARTGMKRRKPTGRIRLNFDYWTTAVRDLPE